MATENPFKQFRTDTTTGSPTNPGSDEVNPFSQFRDMQSPDDMMLGNNTANTAEDNDQEELKDNPFQYLDGLDSRNFTEANYAEVEERGGLPEPKLNMYSDIDVDGGFMGLSNPFGQERKDAFEKALNRYRLYANHPDATRSVLGELMYKGTIVPLPNQGLFTGDMGVSLGQKLALGVRNTPSVILEAGASLVDVAANALENQIPLGAVQFFDENGDFDPKYISGEEVAKRREEDPNYLTLTPVAQSAFADVPKGDGIIDTIAVEGPSMVTGFGAGLKIASTVPLLGKSKIFRFLGGEAGMTAGTSSEVDTLLIGENAMLSGLQEDIPIFRGIEAEPGSAEYNKVLAARTNILMDAIMLGGTIDTAAKGIKGGTVLAYNLVAGPILDLVSPTAKQARLTEQILDRLAGVTGDPVRDDAARREIISLIEENKDVLIEVPPEMGKNIEYATSTMDALERALADNDDELAMRILNDARSLQKGALNTPELSTLPNVANKPKAEAVNVLEQTEEALGGSDAIQESASGLRASGKAEVDALTGEVDRLSAELESLGEDLAARLRDDPELGAQIDALERASGISIYKGPEQSSTEIVSNVRAAYESMTATKDELFNAVEGGVVEADTLINVMDGLGPDDALDASISAMPGTTQIRELIRVTRKIPVEELDAAGKPVLNKDGKPVTRLETDAERSDRVAEYISENGLDYGRLYKDIRPLTSQAANDLFAGTGAEKAAGRKLRMFVQEIDGRFLDDVANSGDEAVADAATEALDYYRTQYAPFFRDGTGGQIAELYESTVGRSSANMRQEGIEIGSINFKSKAREVVEGALQDSQFELGNQIIDIVARPEGGSDVGLVTDYFIANALKKLSGRIDEAVASGKGLDSVNYTDIRNALEGYKGLLQGREEFADQVTRLDTLVDNLKTGKLQGNELQTELITAKEAAEEAKVRILDNELGVFFKKQGIDAPNAYESFRQLLTSPQSADTLQSLVDRAKASDNPVVLEGMQAAYMRFMRSPGGFIGTASESGGARNILVRNQQLAEDQIKPILEYGDIIFQDRPEIMEATTAILREAGLVSKSQATRSIRVGSDTAFNKEAIEAVNRFVMFTMGPLTRGGARLRAGAAGAINKFVDPTEANRMLDELYSNPDEFVRVAKIVTDQKSPPNPEKAKALRIFLIRSQIYSEDNAPSETDLLTALSDAEFAFRDVRNKTRDAVDNQMNQILSP